MAHTPVNGLRGDMKWNAEDHIYAKLHVEYSVSCALVLKYMFGFFVWNCGIT